MCHPIPTESVPHDRVLNGVDETLNAFPAPPMAPAAIRNASAHPSLTL